MKKRKLTPADHIILSDLYHAGIDGMTAIEVSEYHKNDKRLEGAAVERRVRYLHQDQRIGRTFRKRVSVLTGKPSVVYIDLNFGADANPYEKRQCECPECGDLHPWNGNPEWNPDYK